MAITIESCDESDFFRIFCIVSDSFGFDQPYIDAIFPNHHEHAGRIQGAQRLLQLKRTDPNIRVIKAIDTSTGEIIGSAKFIIFAGGKPEETPLQGDYWSSEDEKEYASHIFAGYLRPRRETAKAVEGPLVSIDLMNVDPKHQRRGAGVQLVQWGMELAKELEAEMCVETSDAGKHLYEKFGFRVTEAVDIHVPEKWADKPKIEFEFMRRGKVTAS